MAGLNPRAFHCSLVQSRFVPGKNRHEVRCPGRVTAVVPDPYPETQKTPDDGDLVHLARHSSLRIDEGSTPGTLDRLSRGQQQAGTHARDALAVGAHGDHQGVGGVGVEPDAAHRALVAAPVVGQPREGAADPDPGLRGLVALNPLDLVGDPVPRGCTSTRTPKAHVGVQADQDGRPAGAAPGGADAAFGLAGAVGVGVGRVRGRRAARTLSAVSRRASWLIARRLYVLHK